MMMLQCETELECLIPQRRSSFCSTRRRTPRRCPTYFYDCLVRPDLLWLPKPGLSLARLHAGLPRVHRGPVPQRPLHGSGLRAKAKVERRAAWLAEAQALWAS